VSEATGDTREIFETYQRERGNIPNMFRTMAHRPEILQTMIRHFRAVLAPGSVGLRLKELIAVAVSGLNGCEYWLASHTVLAGRAGAGEEEIAAARDGRFESFGEKERAALEFAAAMSRDAHSIDDTRWAELRSHFDEGEIVEIAAVAGLFNYFNRFNDALRVEPTR
jgi:uncharacterized peroxidase-related enzyme